MVSTHWCASSKSWAKVWIAWENFDILFTAVISQVLACQSIPALPGFLVTDILYLSDPIFVLYRKIFNMISGEILGISISKCLLIFFIFFPFCNVLLNSPGCPITHYVLVSNFPILLLPHLDRVKFFIVIRFEFVIVAKTIHIFLTKTDYNLYLLYI